MLLNSHEFNLYYMSLPCIESRLHSPNTNTIDSHHILTSNRYLYNRICCGTFWENTASSKLLDIRIQFERNSLDRNLLCYEVLVLCWSSLSC